MSQETATVPAPAIAPPPLVIGEVDLKRLDDDINRPLESFPTKRWWAATAPPEPRIGPEQ